MIGKFLCWIGKHKWKVKVLGKKDAQRILYDWDLLVRCTRKCCTKAYTIALSEEHRELLMD